MKRNKGFTLIEVMIVVMIIGILITLVIPIWGKYKQELIKEQDKRPVIEQPMEQTDDLKEVTKEKSL